LIQEILTKSEQTGTTVCLNLTGFRYQLKLLPLLLLLLLLCNREEKNEGARQLRPTDQVNVNFIFKGKTPKICGEKNKVS
jgi:hypothetical protein